MSSNSGYQEFDSSLYDHGCRCACCSHMFDSGDTMTYRMIGERWVTPVCQGCEESGAGLVPDHPLLGSGEILMGYVMGYDGRLIRKDQCEPPGSDD